MDMKGLYMPLNQMALPYRFSFGSFNEKCINFLSIKPTHMLDYLVMYRYENISL